MKPIIECVTCHKTKPHYARNMCENCYHSFSYHNIKTPATKRRAYKKQLKERKDNPEQYRKKMRDYMRKRLNIKPENYYKQK